jgi:hypothetical protein
MASRALSLVVAILLIFVWAMPSHAFAETHQGATIHCADLDPFEASVLSVQDDAFIVGPQILSSFLPHLKLIPQLLVFTIYRPPQF